MANKNFRITTDYVFEIINVYDNNYYPVWISGAVVPTLVVASSPDTTSTELNWDYVVDFIPTPPESASETTNYYIDYSQKLYLINVDTGKWHLVSIEGDEDNPQLLISTQGIDK